MAEKLDWTELSGNGGNERTLLTKQLVELQKIAYEARPWWHKGASWFVAFCLANAAVIWWARELRFIERSWSGAIMYIALVIFALAAAAMQSAQSRRG